MLQINYLFKIVLLFHSKHTRMSYYLLPAAEGRGREIIKCLPYVRVRPSRFRINLNILFIYEDILTKFAGNVYGY